MKETGHGPTLHDSPFTPYHHHFGISALETLPEEEGDNEEEPNFRSRSASPGLTWSPLRVQGHPDQENHHKKLTKDQDEGLERETRSDMLQPTIRHEIERQRAKVLLLETTIRQLQDELRESKDQNELLEFRLLELGDLEASPPSNPVTSGSLGKRCNNRRKSEDSSEDDGGVEALDCGSGTSQGGSVYGEGDGVEVSSEVTGHEGRSNGHASVTEARSSCSDCSESLSFQESGIFETQYPDDPYIPSSSVSRRGQEDVSRELARLLAQIETLVNRFQHQEDGETGGDKGARESSKSPHGGKRKQRNDDDDLSFEFLFCRQRLREFGRKLSKFGNVEYVQSLEAKISDLLIESQKLEEERAEMEEAENDSRNLCQRLEEEVKRMKVKKGKLQGMLSLEQRFVETLRTEVLRLQAKDEDLTTINSSLETSLQSQEQLNFDLEESLIELKDTVQFLLLTIPVFLTWYTLNTKEYRCQLRRRSVQSPPVSALPPFLQPESGFTEIGIQTCPELFLSPSSISAGSLCGEQNDWTPVENELLEKIRSLEKTVAGRAQDLEISQKKLMRVQEEWESLIKELEDFEIESPRKNSNDPPVTRVTSGQTTTPTTTKCRQGSLVANRIRSLFPDTKNPSVPPIISSSKPGLLPKPTDILPKSKTTEIISALRHKFAENLHRMMIIESAGHDGWRPSHNPREKTNPEILHLTAEVNRLERLLSEQEGTTERRLVELEAEAATLRSELSLTGDLKRKIDEAQSNRTRMMNRIEELEQAEMSWKETLGHHEKKAKKAAESINWLRSEVELLAAKCGTLQDEIDTRIRAENLQKQEISILQSELREAERIMQDKDALLVDSSTHFRAQISKLEAQVDKGREELGDVECSNGMLREEVLYFERVVAQVSERGEQAEKLVQILTSKIQERDVQIGQLKTEVAEGRRGAPPNDLDFFARNEGGLTGVCRDVREVLTVVNNCVLCKCAAGRKLGEVSEQLTTLTHMLEGSQEASSIYGMDGHQLSNLSLSRCESEEHLSPQSSSGYTAQSTLAMWSLLGVGGTSHPSSYQRCQVEEHKTLKFNLGQLESELLKKEDEIRKLTEKRRILSSQLKGLEEMRLMREKDFQESHLNETWWWKLRCDEKNELIQILARRIVHLSAINSQGTYVLDGICTEISKVGGSYPVGSAVGREGREEIPLDTTSLLAYFQAERCRILDILESSSCNCNPADLTHSPVNMDFRVLRRIGEDALLLSWCPAPAPSSQPFQGYEICVNGNTHLRVPNPVRCKALLFGLNMAEPLQLSLKFGTSDGRDHEEVRSHQESSITYIA